jgi:drug/metabolite transporter (DMT)-like permease
MSLTYLSALIPLGFIQLTQNLIPIVTAGISYMFLKERVSSIESLMLLICFVIVSITAGFKTSSNDNPIGVIYVLMCLLSVVAFSAINIIGRMLKGIHFSCLCTC